MTALDAAGAASAEPSAKAGRLSLTNITKRYLRGDAVPAVDDLSLEIAAGEFVSLLGPSGCGKTTTLRMIAGFETPSTGTITLDEQDLTATPPNRRPMSMVFQSYALFPHLSVRDNVAYGLKLQRLPRTRIRHEVDEALETMGLSEYDRRAPGQLSGGQQQRVALARALVMKPKVLLFDEPLSNLDAKLRDQMRIQIRQLQQRLGITSVFVTHDQEEAMTMSDRVVVMRAGRVHQIAGPEEIYRRPASTFVADFIGSANFIDVEVEAVNDGHADVVVLGRHLTVPVHEDVHPGSRATLLARPEAIRLHVRDERSEPAGEVGRVLMASFTGGRIDYDVASSAGALSVSDAGQVVSGPAVGDAVTIEIDAARAWVLPRGER